MLLKRLTVSKNVNLKVSITTDENRKFFDITISAVDFCQRSYRDLFSKNKVIHSFIKTKNDLIYSQRSMHVYFRVCSKLKKIKSIRNIMNYYSTNQNPLNS